MESGEVRFLFFRISHISHMQRVFFIVSVYGLSRAQFWKRVLRT